MSFPISIVIPTWNGLLLLRENLPSIQAAAEEYEREVGEKTEIIVVDDGGEDETSSSIASEFPKVQLISRDHNEGFAVACNTGFAKCRFPLVALFNNDVRISPDYLLYQALHFRDPQVFAVTPKVFEWEHPIFASGGRFARFRKGFWSVYFNYDVSLPQGGQWIAERRLLSAYAIGGFATYSKAKLEALGGFNELLSPFHWEDIDLSYRGWKRGWEVHYEPRSIARHRTSATIEAHFKKRLVEEVSVRNRLLFHWINIHSPGFLTRHLLMLTSLFCTRILALDIGFYRACFQALKRLPQVRRLRRTEETSSRRTDAEISRLLNNFYDSAPIEIYYNRQDVIRKHPEFKETQA